MGEAMYGAYFYDADRIKLNFPLTESAESKLVNDGYMGLVGIDRKDDRWIIFYISH